jgi:hypothetical protein
VDKGRRSAAQLSSLLGSTESGTDLPEPLLRCLVTVEAKKALCQPVVTCVADVPPTNAAHRFIALSVAAGWWKRLTSRGLYVGAYAERQTVDAGAG